MSIDSNPLACYKPAMSKIQLPASIRRKFAEAGRRGGLAGKREDKVRAARIRHDKNSVQQPTQSNDNASHPDSPPGK